MALSTHQVEVVEIKELLPHPNADKLAIVPIWEYRVCVDKTQWKVGDLAAYIVPDSIVDTSRPEFSFLSSGHIKVKKLRGQISQGLLVPAPAGAKVGDNVASLLGVTRYEPVVHGMKEEDNEDTSGPLGWCPKYDVENFYRYSRLFVQGEPVQVTEKVHGANARYTFANGTMYVGSRTRWKKENERNDWWVALYATPTLKEWCEAHPGHVVYGEVYGAVKGFRYGVEGRRFAAFDIWDMQVGCWLNAEEARAIAPNIPWVPLLENHYPFDLDKLKEMAEGPSVFPNAQHIREGIVVKPMMERQDSRFGRVCLKIVGNGFLLTK